jgi:Flp pilus assembly protein CpaB
MKIWIAAIALLCAGAASAQPGKAPSAAEAATTAAEMAATLQAQAPLDLGHGIRATSIRAEGTVVVWTIDLPAEAMEGRPAREAEAALIRGFCSGDASDFFAAGISLRLDIVVGAAAPVRGTAISSCPSA